MIQVALLVIMTMASLSFAEIVISSSNQIIFDTQKTIVIHGSGFDSNQKIELDLSAPNHKLTLKEDYTLQVSNIGLELNLVESRR